MISRTIAFTVTGDSAQLDFGLEVICFFLAHLSLLELEQLYYLCFTPTSGLLNYYIFVLIILGVPKGGSS